MIFSKIQANMKNCFALSYYNEVQNILIVQTLVFPLNANSTCEGR